MIHKSFMLLIVLIMLTSCGTRMDSSTEQKELAMSVSTDQMTSVSASWPFSNMISFNNLSYLGTDETIDNIDHIIGQIDSYSDQETAVQFGNFSNFYPTQTKLYKIKNVDIEDEIAIEVAPHVYVKAIRNPDHK
ncbi:hypothetical protein [Paenibacillus pini]|uniref:Lipoprotein n=1 Tax=Paenibacillus pini JCM 16418 TaxID=1236976 RepID=W7YV97_9BACL|nr:hypothetical protein [Paenibacillus pini]GAF08531.1 hypothetical protein JCM16418_2613 [Paenibacillus pini JCM 16418]